MVHQKDYEEFKNILVRILHLGGTKGLEECLKQLSTERGYNILTDFLEEVKELHPTEQKYPEQCKMFKEITDRMYALHLDKNHDYSPVNMLATGLDGAVVRLWDKIARIMNLCGFDILKGTRTEIKDPKNESLEDSFFDSANYSIIALILRAGKWGK